MVLFTGFRATTLSHAFILNSLASAIIIVTAIYLKGSLDRYKDYKGRVIRNDITFPSVSITFIVTFLASLIGYWSLYYTFGFGGGMLVSE